MGLIRTLLALAVVSFHAVTVFQMDRPFGVELPSGPVAVQAFYVISGFLMSLILTIGYRGRPLSFYRSRLLRLLPQYWIVLVATLATLGALTGYFESRISWLRDHAMGPLTYAWIVFTNLTLVGMDWTVFIVVDHARFNMFQPVNQAWTLGLELTFYAMAPWLVRLHSGWIVLMIAASWAARQIAYAYGFDSEPWTYRFFPFEIAWFLSGVLAHRTYMAGFNRWPVAMKRGGIGAIIVLLFVMTNYKGVRMFAADWPAGIYIVQGTVVMCLPLIFAASKDWRFDRMLGLLSYPIYLCHLLLLEHFIPRQMAYSGEIGMVLSIIVAIGLVLAVSPIERWRHLRGRGQCRPPRRSVGVDIGAVAGAGTVAAQVERPLRGGQ